MIHNGVSSSLSRDGDEYDGDEYDGGEYDEYDVVDSRLFQALSYRRGRMHITISVT